MNLHVVAYPQLSDADNEMISAIRKDHNSLYNIISHHFTIVFSVPDMSADDFITEVKKQVAGTLTIPFSVRCAILNQDVFSKNFDAFLVPDEGFSSIVKMHDKLYSGKLSPHHRADISYIPHISMANSLDVMKVKKVADHFNALNHTISGTITALDVINYENRVITTLEKIQLL